MDCTVGATSKRMFGLQALQDMHHAQSVTCRVRKIRNIASVAVPLQWKQCKMMQSADVETHLNVLATLNTPDSQHA